MNNCNLYMDSVIIVETSMKSCSGGFAHGDCRRLNVLVRKKEECSCYDVRFVDFDWSGLEGERLYPPFMSEQIQWPIGAIPGEPLMQAHDVELLNMSP